MLNARHPSTEDANSSRKISRSDYLMLRMAPNDRMPIIMSSRLTVFSWPTLQRAKENLMLISTCTRKKKTRNISRLVWIYMASLKGSSILFHQAYPEMRKRIMKIRSIQALARFILTRSRPLFNAISPPYLLTQSHMIWYPFPSFKFADHLFNDLLFNDSTYERLIK